MNDAERLVGTTLNGKYRIEQLLGVGGMAVVYRATHRNGHRVAVKVLHAALSTHADLRDRFLREGYVANRVDHRGAVRVLDDDTTPDGLVFLVMELLEGETLEERRTRAGMKLAYREVAELTCQLLDVLAAAHEKEIVHRDVKPDNLFLTHEGVLKVLDFGIARLRDVTGGFGGTSATKTGHLLGTPAYMPVEQVLGHTREVDGQTDLWAVGATMFTLISGYHVHEAETVAEMLVYAGSRRARPLASVAPEVPVELARVVDRALAFEKSDRWPTARVMQGALQSVLLGGATSSATHPSASGPTAHPPVGARSASTTGGVESPPATHAVGAGAGRGRGRRVVAGVGAAMLLGAVAAAALVRHRSAAGESSPITIVTGESTRAAVPTPAAPGAEPSREPSQPPAGERAASTDAGAPTVLRASAAAEALRPPVHVTTASAAPRAAARPATSGPSSIPLPRPNCDPPYMIDGAGRRIPRPECL